MSAPPAKNTRSATEAAAAAVTSEGTPHTLAENARVLQAAAVTGTVSAAS